MDKFKSIKAEVSHLFSFGERRGGANNYKSPGFNPVCFAILASIFGPISAPS
jgi:hypothetical protein